MYFYFIKGEFVLKTTRVAHIKSNGALVFHSKMNCILFPVNFTSRDYDIFFTICWYAKQFWYLESRNYIEILYTKILEFFTEGLKTCFNNEMLEFYKRFWAKTDQ